ncbi:MAG: glycosyltransferase family 4 protein [Gammaproteobacteria bacterium]|nr:glycosyltransferase family 4 protein [Gammaproteobacteria bacterium]
MKLLLLAKRRPQNRDLLERPFGRFHHLPAELARHGHRVTVLLASYANEPDACAERDGVTVRSISVRGAGAARYLAQARRLARSERPDWIGGLSDTWYAVLAAQLARRAGARLWVDAYDNYASYIPWAWPLHAAWRRAAARADLLTVAGPTLLELLGHGRDPATSLVLPMAPDPPAFRPGPGVSARQKLGLPVAVPLIFFGGGVHRSRDLETLFQAVEIARRTRPELRLVLSGRRFSGVDIPSDAIWLGYLADADMPALYQAVDLVAVMNRPGAFGDYSYPIKLYEAMACGRPVVASRTASTAWVLRDHSHRLVPPEDPQALAQAIGRFIDEGQVDYGELPQWEQEGVRLATALQTIQG